MSGIAETLGISQVQLDSVIAQLVAMQNSMPSPATAAPPAVADNSVLGSVQQYALANHTHASKVRKVRMQCAADGSLNWTYSTPFDVGVVPIVLAVAETALGVTDVVNVQVESTPTNVGATLRVTKTVRSAVSLIGLTVLSLPASVGVTWVHAIAIAP